MAPLKYLPVTFFTANLFLPQFLACSCPNLASNHIPTMSLLSWQCQGIYTALSLSSLLYSQLISALPVTMKGPRETTKLAFLKLLNLLMILLMSLTCHQWPLLVSSLFLAPNLLPKTANLKPFLAISTTVLLIVVLLPSSHWERMRPAWARIYASFWQV